MRQSLSVLLVSSSLLLTACAGEEAERDPEPSQEQAMSDDAAATFEESGATSDSEANDELAVASQSATPME